MDLHIQKVADRMGEKRGAGQSTPSLSPTLVQLSGGSSMGTSDKLNSLKRDFQDIRDIQSDIRGIDCLANMKKRSSQ
jgi:hypothetical protein